MKKAKNDLFHFLALVTFIAATPCLAEVPMENLDPPMHTMTVRHRSWRQPVDRLATLAGERYASEVIVRHSGTGKPVFAKKLGVAASRIHLNHDGNEAFVFPAAEAKSPEILRFDLATGGTLEPVPLTEPLLFNAVASPSGDEYLAALCSKRLLIWRLADGKVVFDREMEESYSSIIYAPDQRSILACRKGGIDQIGLPDGAIKRTFTVERMSYAVDAIPTPDGKGLVASVVVLPRYFRIARWNLDDTQPDKIVGEIQGDYISRQFDFLAFSADGKQLSASGNFGPSSGHWGILFSYPELGERDQMFKPTDYPANDVRIAPDGRHMIAVGDDMVSRFDATTGKLDGRYALTLDGKRMLER